jgi:death-on-curing protein
MNHGFLDGNKRTAIYALGILLSGSGYTLQFPSVRRANIEVEKMVLDVVAHKLEFDGLVRWIKARLVRVV